AGTVHLGGRLEEVMASEEAVARGKVHERPFVLLSQPSAFDPTRAPTGQHVVWAYCHVPNGWAGDATDAVLRQIERFAPGVRDRIIGQHVLRPSELETYNANYVGGDINGGLQHWAQFFTRPAVRWDPYSTPDPRLFVCSSSTPPGGGVHGLCGLHAARSALRGILR
ncbi:MAG: phytoene desaturase family protein, partial [Candidatus Limnocylindria bacterium]